MVLTRQGGAEFEQLSVTCVEQFSFSFDFFFLVEISKNTHNLVWTEITLEISEPKEGIRKDTRQRQMDHMH